MAKRQDSGSFTRRLSSSISAIVNSVKEASRKVSAGIRDVVSGALKPANRIRERIGAVLPDIARDTLRMVGSWRRTQKDTDTVAQSVLGGRARRESEELEALRREVAYLRKEVERMRRFEDYYKYAQEKVRQVEARTQLYERIASDMKKGKPIADAISDIIREIEAGMESDYRVVSGQMTEMEYADEKIHENRDILTQSGIDYLRQLALRKNEERVGSGIEETKAEKPETKEEEDEKEKKRRSIFDAVLDFMSDVSERIADVVVGKKK